MKNTVIKAIPGRDEYERFLWRLDVEPGDRLVLYAVTAKTKPEWKALWEACGRHDEAARMAVREYEPMLARLEPGQEYAFRLTANPTYSEPSEDLRTPAEREAGHPRGRGIRRPCKNSAEQLNWLLKRAERAGFTIPKIELPGGFIDEEPDKVPDVVLTSREAKRFTKPKRGEAGTDESPRRQKVTVTRVGYEGRLRIEDVEAMRLTLVAGLGSAKAYGAGLMTLARL